MTIERLDDSSVFVGSLLGTVVVHGLPAPNGVENIKFFANLIQVAMPQGGSHESCDRCWCWGVRTGAIGLQAMTLKAGVEVGGQKLVGGSNGKHKFPRISDPISH